MKNFSKTLISMAAVMAVGSAMAVSAFAAMRAEYDNGTLTVTGASTHGARQTILLVAGTNATDVTAETDTYVATGDENGTPGTIKHINQDDTASATFNGNISVQTLAAGNYELRISGTDGQVESYKFTVSNTPKVEYEQITVGDVNLTDNKSNLLDAALILKKDAGMDEEGEDCGYVGNSRNLKLGANGHIPVLADKETITIGDVNFTDNKSNLLDAALILKKDAGMDEEGEDCGYVGERVWVEKK